MRSKILRILLLGLFFSATPQIVKAQGPALWKITAPVAGTTFDDTASIVCSGTGSLFNNEFKISIVQRDPVPDDEIVAPEGTITVAETWAISEAPPGGRWPSKPGAVNGFKTAYRLDLYRWDGNNWQFEESLNIYIKKTGC